MTRSFHQFLCENDHLVGTLNSGSKETGLLIVSGGNEIRSGAHAGMTKLAQQIAKKGFPVFRFDRRGIGESSGSNQGFLSSKLDIEAAVKQFKELCPHLKKIAAFGNCDAATALALFGPTAGLDAYILANPWVIENDPNEKSEAPAPNAAAIRSRYLQRISNPRSILDLLTGKIDISKLFKGLKQASKKPENSGLAIELRDALVKLSKPVDILLAKRDTTALAFMASWKSGDYLALHEHEKISLLELDSASHSFANEPSKKWLEEQILTAFHKA